MKARVDYLTNFDLSTDGTMSKFSILFLQRFVRSLRGTGPDGTERPTMAPTVPNRQRPEQTGTVPVLTCFDETSLRPVFSGPNRVFNGLCRSMPSQTPAQTVRDSISTSTYWHRSFTREHKLQDNFQNFSIHIVYKEYQFVGCIIL